MEDSFIIIFEGWLTVDKRRLLILLSVFFLLILYQLWIFRVYVLIPRISDNLLLLFFLLQSCFLPSRECAHFHIINRL